MVSKNFNILVLFLLISSTVFVLGMERSNQITTPYTPSFATRHYKATNIAKFLCFGIGVGALTTVGQARLSSDESNSRLLPVAAGIGGFGMYHLYNRPPELVDLLLVDSKKGLEEVYKVRDEFYQEVKKSIRRRSS